MGTLKLFLMAALVLGMLLPLGLAQALSLRDFYAVANGPFLPFGGRILVKAYQVCLIAVPPPIFVFPIPFVYYEIGPPRPGKFYYLYGFSTTYRRYQRDVTAWSLGNAVQFADDAFRRICTINGSALPDADGVILKIGTSCVQGAICE